MNTKWNNFKTWVKGILKKIKFPNITYKHIVRLAFFIGKIVAGAITLFVFAHFVPELRIKLPYLYLLIDKIIDIFNEISKWFVYLINILGGNL